MDFLILEERLSRFIKKNYLTNLDNVFENGEDESPAFSRFKEESILFAFFEYAKYPRPYSKEERIKYLFEKACDYEGILVFDVWVEYNEDFDYYVIFYDKKPRRSLTDDEISSCI